MQCNRYGSNLVCFRFFFHADTSCFHAGFLASLRAMHDWAEYELVRLDASSFVGTFSAYLAMCTDVSSLGDDGLSIGSEAGGPFKNLDFSFSNLDFHHLCPLILVVSFQVFYFFLLVHGKEGRVALVKLLEHSDTTSYRLDTYSNSLFATYSIRIPC